MKDYLLSSFIVIIILTACGSRESQSSSSKDPIVISDSLCHDTSFLNTTISVRNYSIKNDTLTILTIGDFMDYPLGKYNTIEEFNNSIGGIKNIKEIEDNVWLDSVFISNDTLVFVKLNDISSMDDSVKIVYAKIVTPQTILINNIQIGMKQIDFFKKIDLPLNEISNTNINVIILEKIIVGVWQSYYFNENKCLDSIIIKTDYIF